MANKTVQKSLKSFLVIPPSATTAGTTASIADPTSLRRELDERMKTLESEGDAMTTIGWIKKSIQL